mmetsp:Transcript_39248/g.79278  ORF Transcript_39248/g.79278 Transcript_39248/m.79278 type:complete len:216 (-) Transcript_39248:44-691(-)
MVKKIVKRGPAKPRIRVAETAEPLGQVVEDKTAEELQRKRELAKEAIASILEGISKPEMQNGVKAYIPHDWPSKYKKDLGPYKLFLKQHPKVFTIIDHDPCNFTVVKFGEAPKPAARSAKKNPDLSWQKQLFKAWMLYCKVTPKPDRDVAAFAGAIQVKAGSGEGPAASAEGGSANGKKAGKRKDGADAPAAKAGKRKDGADAPAAKAAKKKRTA